MRAAQIGVFVTEAVLNRLSRDGVRMRSYALAPGDIMPCAVWDDDEMVALRLRGAFAGVNTITLVQRLSGGEELSRTADLPLGATCREIIYVTPAAWLRPLPSADLEVTLVSTSGGAERTIGSYTLRHAGAMRR